MEELAQQLLGLKGKRVLLLTHHNADPDAICSAILMQHFFKHHETEATIGVVETASRLSQRILEQFKIGFEKDPSLENVDALVLLDMATEGQLSEYAGTFNAFKGTKLIIDHHTRQEASLAVDYKYVNEQSSSTVEIVYQLFQQLQVPLSKDLVYVALFGLVAETAHLRFAKPELFRIIANLLEENGIQYNEILDLVRTPVDISERIANFKAAKRIKAYKIGQYIVVTSIAGSFEASTARGLLRMGADVAAIGSPAKKQARVSIRSKSNFQKDTGVDLGKDVIPVVAKILGGTGSGHPTAAGANGRDSAKLDAALRSVLETIKEKTGESYEEI